MPDTVALLVTSRSNVLSAPAKRRPSPRLGELCPIPWEDQTHSQHQLCQGTGKLHPEFWERCYSPHQRGECLGIHSCDGSGWILVVTLEKVLNALEATGYNHQEFWCDESGLYLLRVGVLKSQGTGPTRQAAALDVWEQVEQR